jgi:hypothetical protein
MAVNEQNVHPGVAGVVATLVVAQGVDGRIVIVVLEARTDVTVVGNVSSGAEVGLAGAAVDLAVAEVTILVQQVEVGTVGGVVGEKPVELTGVHEESQADLLEVTSAVDAAGFLTGFAQGGEKHAGEDGDNRDHDEQFDQGKTFFAVQFHGAGLLLVVVVGPKCWPGLLLSSVSIGNQNRHSKKKMKEIHIFFVRLAAAS